MEYRALDKLGIKTSLLGFGCMRFPRNEDGSINESASFDMIDEAYRSGVNYYDTAYIYHEGKSEEFTGRALEKYDRASYYLADKLPCWMVETLEDAKRIFEEQRKRLNRDCIDFYLLHSLGGKIFDKMVSLGVLEYCEQLRQEGKIKYLGFSFHDEYEAFEHIAKFRDWDFCQIQLNYMDTDIQAGIKGYQLTERLGIPLIVMEPIKGGTLADLPEEVTSHFTQMAPEYSVASWALRWVGSLPNVKVILSGMSSEEQVKDNLKTFDQFEALKEQEYGAVAKVVQALNERVKNGCTGCKYCMPCPAGVDIPKNFSIWNNYGMYQNAGLMNWLWGHDIGDGAKAKNCIDCGTCETHCPQKISIRDNLKELQKELDLVIQAK